MNLNKPNWAASAQAAAVVFLFAVGELLESVAAGRARAGIKALATQGPLCQRERVRLQRFNPALQVFSKFFFNEVR